MNKLKLLIASLLFIGGVSLVLPTGQAGAVNVFDRACTGRNANTARTELCSNRSDNASSMVRPIVSTLLMIVGIVAVIVIIIGGIMYVASAGDPGKTKRAKDTILYAVIGLIVAILAYSIVEFVVTRF